MMVRVKLMISCKEEEEETILDNSNSAEYNIQFSRCLCLFLFFKSA